jgi:hypothetical protein
MIQSSSVFLSASHEILGNPHEITDHCLVSNESLLSSTRWRRRMESSKDLPSSQGKVLQDLTHGYTLVEKNG